MFIHLKEDLEPDPIDWEGCLDPIEKRQSEFLTDYGIAKDIQQCLAATRTDLDSFSDIEAYALMTSAYRMTENAFQNKKCIDGFSDKGEIGKWEFLKIENSLKGESESYEYVKKMLGASNSLFFKIWKQLPTLKIAAGFLILFVLAGIIGLFIVFADKIILNPISIGNIGIWLAGLIGLAVAGYLFGRFVKIIRWRETLTRIVFGVGMCLFGWIIARFHLHLFDKMFLKHGSLNFLNKKSNANQE